MRIQFIKKPDKSDNDQEPDMDAPMLSTEKIRQLEANTDPLDDIELTPGHWLMSCTGCGTYNYIDHWYPPEEDDPDDCDAVDSFGQPVKQVRDRLLGPDSSFASTLIPSGLASYSIHLNVNRNIQGIYGPDPQQVRQEYSRYYRNLFLGKTIGQVEQLFANYRSSYFGPAPYPGTPPVHFASDNYLVGEPSIRLHRQGPWGTNQIRILAAPGPGSTRNHPGEVRGFDRSGNVTLTFRAFGNDEYGCNVAGGNVDASARDEIIVGSGFGPNLTPFIRGFNDDGTGIPTINFIPQAGGPAGYGANVALVDVDNDDTAEIFYARGPDPAFGPEVRGFQVAPGALGVQALTGISFFAFPNGFYGANVAGGHVLRRQGTRGQLVVTRGPDPNFVPQVRVFYLAGFPLAPVLSSVEGNVSLPGTYGAHVAVGDVDGDIDGYDDLVFGAGPGPNQSAALVAYSGGRDDTLARGPFLSSPNVFGDAALYGLRVGVSNLDLDLPKEILAGRGWDPSQSFVNSRVLKIDYQGNSPALDFQAFPTDTGGGTGGGVSIAGMELGNVPGLPASPVETPIEILPPIDGIAQTCPESLLSDGDASRARIHAASQEVLAAIIIGDPIGMRRKILKLRTICRAEVVCPFLRAEFSTSVDALDASVDLLEANQPPVAVIEGPQGLVCPGQYTFSGLGSTDPDERPLYREEIQIYQWTLDAVDDTPPSAVATAYPSTLWPPNHDMVPIFVDLAISDDCIITNYRLLGVVSDEPETGCGSGNQAPDIQGMEAGQPDVEFEVRAERCGTGDGRTYTATYQVDDKSGNSTMVSATITVPHDKR